MPLKEREIDECRRERKTWLLICVVSGIVFTVLMDVALVYDIRFKYGFFVVILAFIVMFASFVMYSFTQYISTKEIVSILIGKVRGIFD
jgi:hypothetical protein